MGDTLQDADIGSPDLHTGTDRMPTVSCTLRDADSAAKPASDMPSVKPPRFLRCHAAPPFVPPTGCRRVTLPFYGFVLDADDDHRARVDRFFHVPMLVLSVLVLPILAAQIYFSSRMIHPWVPYLLDAAFLLVSIAFLVEFIIKVTIARSRWRYALANWLDIMIIVLPFLRPFRAARILRVAQILPAYSFRGVYAKFIRSGGAVIMGMALVRRIRGRFARPEEPSQALPDYAQWSKAALIAEIQRLQDEIRELRRRQP